MTLTLASKLTEDEDDVVTLRSDLRKQEGSRLACKHEADRVLRVASSRCADDGIALISGKERIEE